MTASRIIELKNVSGEELEEFLTLLSISAILNLSSHTTFFVTSREYHELLPRSHIEEVSSNSSKGVAI
ncbi:PREDICTED: uncharacterized protein LOC108362039 isoform X2 [Rhagoletis zephyria]|uniref:uncharacterized protein LOC108362039 isoform X2 n=1 Tax=Rhagoletis zephyria TaxID=28612 RepID=UPI0008114D95|nr:PREDICTED: uncharacterized protein LOC108362039 isoform X2 [Rhagoletis zephyria]